MVLLVESRVHVAHKILVDYLCRIFQGIARLQMSWHLFVASLQLRYATHGIRAVTHLKGLVVDRRPLTVVLRNSVEAVDGGHVLIGADINRLVA